MMEEKQVMNIFHTIKAGETLFAISQNYRVPLTALIAANPHIDPTILHIGEKVRIPHLPSPGTLPYKLKVSLSKRTLTLITSKGKTVKVYPVGVGKMLSKTPVGDFVIINKAPNPGGPYGAMWMGLSKKSYGIHGTNNPASIGKYVSKGCIRMYNKDVLELSRIVPIGTRVMIRP
ncbi:L,D-transpeptidase family protein [Bacillus xiapuensis]|uniref:L,D-transpeptidase family protein n=1 Tax=Bacillus xiapuensis TaxID=2014075 RepID=UPI001E494B6A|nr:L,D-transpeptidase family protein [Bacillus xiapuensis]